MAESGLVWITGASAGIGRAVALHHARRGWMVAASARGAEGLGDLIAAAPAGRIRAFPLDVADGAATRAAVAAIEAAMGPIDRAILNAGTHRPLSADRFSAAPFEALWRINVMGAVHGLDALIPVMRRRGRGQIAIVASVAGYRGLPTSAAYGATKAALINMAEALKPELDALGIDLRLINPGFVRTPLTDRNPFPMPFLMEPEAAAARIHAGLAGSAFETTFPRRLTWVLKCLRILPYRLFFKVTRRMMPATTPSGATPPSSSA